MRRLIALAVLFAFCFTQAGFAQELIVNKPQRSGINLAPASILDDILDGTPHKKNLSLAEIVLQMDLADLAKLEGFEGATTETAIKTAFEKHERFSKKQIYSENTKFSPADIKAFFNQPIHVRDHIFYIPVTVTKNGKTNHYRLLFSTIKHGKIFPWILCTFDQFDKAKAEIASFDTLPVRGATDAQVIARYIQHEQGVDAVIRYAHEKGLAQKPLASKFNYKETVKGLLWDLKINPQNPNHLIPIENREFYLIPLTAEIKELIGRLPKTKVIVRDGDRLKEIEILYDAHSSNTGVHAFMSVDDFNLLTNEDSSRIDDFKDNLAGVVKLLGRKIAREMGVMLNQELFVERKPAATIGSFVIGDVDYLNELEKRYLKAHQGSPIPYVETLRADIIDLDTNLATRDYADGAKNLPPNILLGLHAIRVLVERASELGVDIDSVIKNARLQLHAEFTDYKQIFTLRQAAIAFERSIGIGMDSGMDIGSMRSLSNSLIDMDKKDQLNVLWHVWEVYGAILKERLQANIFRLQEQDSIRQHETLEAMPEVIGRVKHLIQSRTLLEELKDNIKARLDGSGKNRIERISWIGNIFKYFTQHLVLNIFCHRFLRIPILSILDKFGFKFLKYTHDEILVYPEEGTPSGLAQAGAYLSFVNGLHGNLTRADKWSLNSHVAVAARNKLITEIDRILFYTEEALRKNPEDTIRVKIYEGRLGLSAILALMILRDKNPEYLQRVEFTVTDKRENHVAMINKMAHLCNLEKNIVTFIERITLPKIDKVYHVQSISIIPYLLSDKAVLDTLHNMQRVAAPGGVIIAQSKNAHWSLAIYDQIGRYLTFARGPELMLKLAEEAGLKAGTEHNVYKGCALNDPILPMMVFVNNTKTMPANTAPQDRAQPGKSPEDVRDQTLAYLRANLSDLASHLPESVSEISVLNILADWRENKITWDAVETELTKLGVTYKIIELFKYVLTSGTIPADSISSNFTRDYFPNPKDVSPEKRVVILISGGEAPGVNDYFALLAKKLARAGYSLELINYGLDNLVKTGEDFDNNRVWVNKDFSDRILHTGGAAAGTARVNIDENNIPQVIGNLKGYCKTVVIVGGNDHTRQAGKLAAKCKEQGLDIAVIALPKTIDHDTVTYPIGARTAGENLRDMVIRAAPLPYSEKCVIIQTMGRDMGMLSVLAGDVGDGELTNCTSAQRNKAKLIKNTIVIALPEKSASQGVSLSMLIEAVKARMKKYGAATLVLSEGFRLSVDDARMICEHNPFLAYKYNSLKGKTDAHGNPQLSELGIADFVAEAIEMDPEIGLKRDRDLFIEDSGYSLRATAPNDLDKAVAEYATDLAVKVIAENRREVLDKGGVAIAADRMIKTVEDIKERMRLWTLKDAEKDNNGALGTVDLFSSGIFTPDELNGKPVLGIKVTGKEFLPAVNVSEIAALPTGMNFELALRSVNSQSESSRDLKRPNICAIVREDADDFIRYLQKVLRNDGGMTTALQPEDRYLVENTSKIVVPILSTEGLTLSQIVERINIVYEKYKMLNLVIAGNYPIRKDDKMLKNLCEKNEALRYLVESFKADEKGYIRFGRRIVDVIYLALTIEKGMKGIRKNILGESLNLLPDEQSLTAIKEGIRSLLRSGDYAGIIKSLIQSYIALTDIEDGRYEEYPSRQETMTIREDAMLEAKCEVINSEEGIEFRKSRIARGMSQELRDMLEKYGVDIPMHRTKRGKNPEDALKVIALSEDLQQALKGNGFFTLSEYISAYQDIAKRYPFLKFEPNISRTTAMRDLRANDAQNALCERGVLKVRNLEEAQKNIGTDYEFELTEKSPAAIALQYLECMAYGEDIVLALQIAALHELLRLGKTSNDVRRLEAIMKIKGIGVRLSILGTAALLAAEHEPDKQRQILTEISINKEVMPSIREQARTALSTPKAIFKNIESEFGARIRESAEILKNAAVPVAVPKVIVKLPDMAAPQNFNPAEQAEAKIADKLYFIGVSMGGSKLCVVLYKREGETVNPIGEKSISWKEVFNLAEAQDITDPAKVNPDAIVDLIAAKIQSLLKESALTIKDINNIGCAMPTPIDSGAGIAGSDFKMRTLPFDKYPFTQKLSTVLGIPITMVEIKHDARAAVEGEQALGALKGIKSAFYVVQGTGLGGAFANEEHSAEAPELTEPGHHIIGRPVERGSFEHHFRIISKYGKAHPYEVVFRPNPDNSNQITERKAAELIASGKYERNDFIWAIEGESELEEIVAGVGLMPMLQDKNRLIRQFNATAEICKKINEPKDISELAINGTPEEQIVGREIIKYIAGEVGRAMACLSAFSRANGLNFERIVIGSTIAEKMGTDSKGNSLENDFYFRHIREAARSELMERFSVPRLDAEVLSRQIVRSPITQNIRETAGFERKQAVVEEPSVADATPASQNLSLLEQVEELMSQTSYDDNGIGTDISILEKFLSEQLGRPVKLDKNSENIFTEGLAFGERIKTDKGEAFNPGIIRFLPILAKVGIRITVIAPSGAEIAIVKKFNEDQKLSEEQEIKCANSSEDAVSKFEGARFFYYKLVHESAPTGVRNIVSVTAEQIINILGAIRQITDEPVRLKMFKAGILIAQAA